MTFMVKKHFISTQIIICTSLLLFGIADTYAESEVKAEPVTTPKKDDAPPKKQETPEPVIFNKKFLPTGSSNVDVKKYELGTPIPSGVYTSDISVNGQLIDKTEIEIQSDDDGNNAVVCMTERLLSSMNINMSKVNLTSVVTCQSITQLIDQATAEFDISQQLLNVSIPQSYVQRTQRGTVNSNLWEQGINAAFIGYNANYSDNQFEQGGSKTFSTGLDFGVNLSSWRIRHSGYYGWNDNLGSDYQSISTYAQHDLTSLKGQFSIGEVNTSGALYDSVAMTGAQIMSDERMLPDSQRGYAPIIRGVAKTVARVVVSQNNFVIYDITVRPGEFVIDDLYPTGYGGDLEVTVYESDGSQQRFKVPYSAVAQLLRPDTYRYEVSVGQTRNVVSSPQGSELEFVQGTLQYGLSNYLTGYVGTQLAQDYYSAMVGVAVGSTFGSFSFDATHSDADLTYNGKKTGQSLRASYSKNFLETGSSFSLATYRFSTEDFMDLATAANEIGNDGELRSMKPKSRFSASVNQSLGEWGQLSFSGYVENYWKSDKTGTQYQLGYSTNIKSASIGLSATRAEISEYNGEMRTDNSVQLTANIPLDFAGRSTSVSGSLGRDAQGEFNQRLGLNGALGEEQRVSYGLSTGRSGATGDIDVNAFGQYIGNKSTLGASVNKGSGYHGVSANASGMVVAFKDGIVMSPQKGETMVIVKAKGAAGAKIDGYYGMQLDGDGLAVIPNLQPYQMNEIGVDPEGLSDRVELKETSQRFAPRAGSISLLDYQTAEGQSFFASVVKADGKVAEFGADVYDQHGKLVGVIGQGGQLYARLEAPSEWLMVKSSSETCKLALPTEISQSTNLNSLVCR